MKSLLLAILLSGTLAPHDFFVSILTIRHNEKEHTLDLTWRMTAHDIEYALENVASLKLGAGKDSATTAHDVEPSHEDEESLKTEASKEYPKADSLLNRYFMEHLVLFQEDKQLSWKWVGKELDGETLYCYLQVEGVYTPNELLVSNTLLQDVFAEQQNLVHVEGEKMPTRSHTFIRGSSPHTFTW